MLSDPVVVCVDGSGGGDAVEWAAAEAAASGARLRLVHPFRGWASAEVLGLAPLLDCLPAPQIAAARTLEAALARARAVAPDIETEGRMYQGPVGRILVRESRAARLIVLGARGEGRLRRALDGGPASSAAARVAAAAGCPVAVVPLLPTTAGDRPPPRVVVGVDGTTSSAAAVGFAFRAARRRGIPVHAVHAWTPDLPADLEAVAGCPLAREAAALGRLDRALATWRAEFADVPLTTHVVRADPATALIALSDGAALVVIGSPSRRRRLDGLFGSVGSTVLGRVRAPVTIVGSEGRGTARSPLGARRNTTG